MASFDKKIEDNADMKVQIAQAAEAERKRHQEIQRQAASVIGNRNQLELQLGRLTKERDKLTANTRQVLEQVDAAYAAGDAEKAQKLESTAEAFAAQLVNIEAELEQTTTLHQQAVAAAAEAQQQAKQSQARFEQMSAEIRQLESQADQAKMQEHASRSLQEVQGLSENPNVPTLDRVREKIESRYATALGAQELAESTASGRMSEIESTVTDARASSRLDEIRAQMHEDTAALESGAQTEGVAEVAELEAGEQRD